MSTPAADQIRSSWRDYCRDLGRDIDMEAVLDDVVRYLEAGLDAVTVARLLRIRARRDSKRDEHEHELEIWHVTRSRSDLQTLTSAGRITAETAAELYSNLLVRAEILTEASVPLPAPKRKPAAAPTGPTVTPPASSEPARPQPHAAPTPALSAISWKDLVAEHSVMILGSLGAFLLVVSTVLFELYGTSKSGGWTRLLAVAGLDAVFTVAGYLAIGRERLRALGQIYVALAAILLPLVGVAAWTFLELGAKGISVDQALAVTGAACAVVYGLLALRLGLLAYAEIAAVALMVALWGVAGATVGEGWRGVVLAAGPLVYGATPRLTHSREFRHFEWFGHASAFVALAAALAIGGERPHWMPPALFGVLAASYLLWHAITPRQLHAHPGEALATVGSLLLVEAWGTSNFRYLLPFVLAALFILLHRRHRWFGELGALYRPGSWHLHLAIAAGLLTSVSASAADLWPVAAGLWAAVALYVLDYLLEANHAASYLGRALLPLALMATAAALELPAWAGAAVALCLIAYALPMLVRPLDSRLTSHGTLYFYAALSLVAIELRESDISRGEWSGVAALVVAGVAFVLGAESGRVWMAGVSGRALLGGAWFWAVEAAGLTDWRGPADSLLSLIFVALGQFRALVGRPSVSQGRRVLTLVTAAAALGLSFAGPDGLLWWRLTVSLSLLAVAYWWQAASRKEGETPWIAWATLAAASLALVQAAVPSDWRGPYVVMAAIVLTAAWWPARRILRERVLTVAAFCVLSVLAGVGMAIPWTAVPPTWAQSAALLEGSIFLLLWWLMRVEIAETQLGLRAGSAILTSAALLLAGAVLRFNVAEAGVLVAALAALHAAWALWSRQAVERWYSTTTLLVAPVVLFAWPESLALPGVVALEFAVLAALVAIVAVRRSLPALAAAVVIALTPAAHMAVLTLAPAGSSAAEEIGQGVLAFIAGVVGLGLRARVIPRWGWSVELAAALLGMVVVGFAYSNGDADIGGVALLAVAPVVFVAGIQERHWAFPPVALAICTAGLYTVFYDHGADTLLYPAGLGLVGLISWVSARAMSPGGPPRDLFIESARWLGIAALLVAGSAGFAFPDKTAAWSLGAVLAASAFLVDAGVLVLDGWHFERPQHSYAAIVVAAGAGFFLAREVGIPDWELLLPGLGFIACGLLLRREARFTTPQLWRQGLVAMGALLAMGWAIGQTIDGAQYWLVVLLLEGAAAVAGGVVFRSRVLLAIGAGAVALVSLRALLYVAQAGYLFIAFGLVALVLLMAAAALAFGRDRLGGDTRGLRDQIAGWD